MILSTTGENHKKKILTRKTSYCKDLYTTIYIVEDIILSLGTLE